MEVKCKLPHFLWPTKPSHWKIFLNYTTCLPVLQYGQKSWMLCNRLCSKKFRNTKAHKFWYGDGKRKIATTFSVASSSSLVEKCLDSRIQKLDYRKVFELFIFNRFDICQLGSALPLYSQILAESLWVCDKDRPRTTKGGRSRIAHCLLQQK